MAAATDRPPAQERGAHEQHRDQGLLTVATALTGLAGALIGIFKYFKYQSRKDRMDAVGTRFASVVDALGSKDEVKRRAAAIMLRRFFDAGTEFGTAGTPYASEAVNVIAAVLREERSSNFQKLLADGLWYARSLHHADLQKTNLQNAYLGSRGDAPLDLTGADFYRADLSNASRTSAAHATFLRKWPPISTRRSAGRPNRRRPTRSVRRRAVRCGSSSAGRR